jgi:hypothetical protein
MDFITIETHGTRKIQNFNTIKWTFVDFCFFKKWTNPSHSQNHLGQNNIVKVHTPYLKDH